MKKTIILVFAVLLVAASLVSGTFALYNRELGTESVTLQGKQFQLTSNASVVFNDEAIKIAPSETYKATFTVMNYSGEDEDTIVSETDMSVTVSITTNAALPITYSLKSGDTEVVAPTAAGTTLTYSFVLAGGAANAKELTLVAEWPTRGAGEDNGYIGAEAGISVNISSVQIASNEVIVRPVA